jgi:hypothetical protein
MTAERRVTCQFTAEDSARAGRSQLRGPLILFLAAVCSAGVVSFLAGDGFNAGLAIAMVGLLVAILASSELSSRRRWRNIPSLHEPFEVTWTDHEVSIENSVRRATYKPGAFTKVESQAGLLTMWSFDTRVIMIPDRCFLSDAQREDLITVARTMAP